MRILGYARRHVVGDFFAGAQNDDTMRDIEQRPDDMLHQDDGETVALQFRRMRRIAAAVSVGRQSRHEFVEQ